MKLKKFLVRLSYFVVIGVVLLTLAGCGKKKVDTDTVKTADNVAVNDVKNIGSKSYYLDMEMIQKFNGKQMDTELKVARKGKNYMVEMVKLPGDFTNVQFTPKKTVVKDGKMYSLVNFKGKDMWIYVDNSGLVNPMQGDIYEMLAQQLKNSSTDKKVEKIDGEKMTCYYYNEMGSSSKICVKNGYIKYAYGKGVNGEELIVKIKSYTTNVSDELFEVKGKIYSTTDLAKMLGNYGSGGNYK